MPDLAPPAVRLGSTTVDACTMEQAVDAVMRLVAKQQPALIVTPNVDHLVMIEADGEFAAAYARASLRVADGAPLVALARMLHTPLPERVAGVDLTNAVLRAAETSGKTVFFFGGAPWALERAVARISEAFPDLRVVGTTAPDVDLDAPTEDERAALAAVRSARPDLLVLFLGTPKQEKWFWRRQEELPPTVALAVGGTVDMLAGIRKRAPKWVQRIGFEWIWRMVQDPLRLGRRYLVRDRAFFGIARRDLRDARRERRRGRA
jgi:N-acetylglucosaminyldiphosphoundecaprenol N-acetyl-beta-D-mannosaminyltransferase